MSIYSEMLNRIKQVGVKNALSENTSEEFFCQLSDLRRNLLAWYDFKEESDILEIGGECGSITSLLCDKAKTVISFEPNKEKAEINRFVNIEKDNLKIVSDSLDSIKDSFDYVIIAGALEIAPSFIDGDDPFKSLLLFAKNHLNEGGTILLATDNRIGARCFAGYPESHLNKYFTGINDYRGINNVRTFSKNELKDLYISAGLFNKAFYYPYPDYKYPTEIFTDRTINSSLYGRPYPNYSERYAEIIDENKLLQDYAKEGVADTFANSFLVELTSDHSNKKKIDVEYIKISIDRKEKFQIYTKIWNDGTNRKVSKYAINQNGVAHIDKMREVKYEGKGFGILKNRSRKSGILTYPFLSQTSLDKKAYELIQKKDGDSVIKLFDLVKDTFMSETVLEERSPYVDSQFVEVFGKREEEEKTYKCIKSTCFDLILDNIFDMGNKLVIIDYEWFFDFFIPSEYLMWRSINELFYKYPELYNLVDRTALLNKYGVTVDSEEVFRRWESNFVNKYVGGNRFVNNNKEKLNIDVDSMVLDSYEKEYPVSALYLDCGEGFLEENHVESPLQIDENGHFVVSFNVDSSLEILNIKWDPVGACCKCSEIKMFINKEEVDSFYCNGINQDGSDVFLTNDPYYLFNLFGTNIRSVRVEGNIELISRDDYYIETENVINFVNDKFRSKEETIEEVKNEVEQKVEEISGLNNIIDERNDVISEKTHMIYLKDRELNAYDTYLSSIRGSKIWNIYRAKKGTKKIVKSILEGRDLKIENNVNNIKYNIEKFSYINGLLSVSGWMFAPVSKIERLSIVIKTKDEEKEKSLDFSIRREDIKIAYNHVAAYDSGFDDKFIVRINGKAEVYLRAYVNDNEYSIKIGNIKGDSVVDSVLFTRYKEICEGDSLVGQEDIIKYGDDTKYYFEDTIDLIIPIYNGYDYLKKLLVDIRKTKVKSHIILVDDKSPDEKILPLLKEYSSKYDNVELVCNEENLGFVKTVNKGLSLSNNHVVLVNTDVELPDEWLERLMYPIVKYGNVASTTPFANSATIFSFPNFAENNPIYKELSVDEIDTYFKAFKPRYTVVPTGMGFLMGMNRNVINEIGFLDEESFGKGFGEENDWCQRAAKKYYYNVHVENLFAYHKHGGSFVSEEKQKLLEENSKTLDKKHPNYFADVARFCEKNPLEPLRNTIKLQIDCNYRNNKVIVAFNHDLGGGADSYLKQQIIKWNNSDNIVLEVRYIIFENRYELRIHNKDTKSIFFDTIDELEEYIKLISVDEIVINELVTYPNLFGLLDEIVDLSNSKKCKLTMLMHDYFAVSPTINLVSVQNYNYSFDGEYFDCDKYFHSDGFDKQYSCSSIDEWRDNWKAFLKKCDEVRAFSNDTINILNNIYGDLKNISLVPHKVEYMIPIKRKRKITNTLNIGLLGVLSEHKGKRVVDDLIKQVEQDEANIRFVLIGIDDPSDPNPIEENKYFRKTGKYFVEDLPRIVLENDIDIFLIPSIWPETFSYTTEEIIKMNYPVACFDFGAPAERVKVYDKGCILDSRNPKEIIETFNSFASELKIFDEIKEESRKVLCIAEYISFSSRYRMEHFQEQLILEGIESKYISVEDLDTISDDELEGYSHIFIYRCRYMGKLIGFLDRVKDKPIIYDIDDYIYDYDKILGLEFLEDEEYAGFESYSNSIRECMNKADVITTSTNTLARIIGIDFPDKTVVINRNLASMAMYILSQKATLSTEKHEGVVLGYFSGSKTHNNDFKLIEDSIIQIMNTNKDVRLMVVGCLKLSDKFNSLLDRVDVKDFVDWRELPFLLSSADINLMPLEDTFFNCCKSENKWTEAALVKRATIASCNCELNEVTDDGNNIVLCSDSNEWLSKLESLIDDTSSISLKAYKYVQDNKLTVVKSDQIYKILL